MQAAAAHACYVAAGALPQLLEPGARLCLPGADHRGRSRSFADSVAALQRSEALEWARCQGECPAVTCNTDVSAPFAGALLFAETPRSAWSARMQQAVVASACLIMQQWQ